MTGNLPSLAIGLVVGAAFGAVYLGLLWAGVRALAGPHPTTQFLLLLAARLILVIATLATAIALGAGTGELLAGLAGFIAARLLAKWRIQVGGPAWK